MASVVAALGSSQQPVEIDRARIERQIRELALEHAGGRLGDDTSLARLKALREQRDAIVAMARPTGFERADAINIRIPIEGAGEAWLTGESA
jgi:hypothetical protein